MISPVNINTNQNQPSFRGIVKVGRVFLNNGVTTDFKAVDTAVKRLKAGLMRQADTETNYETMRVFRYFYKLFDPDYCPPPHKMTGDTRAIMSKVRAKGSSQSFIVSGEEAKDVANSGVDIGRKRALETNYPKKENIGSEERARNGYREGKSEIECKFYSSKTHPQITIYTQTDKNGVIRLKSAKIENDFYSSPKICLDQNCEEFKKQNVKTLANQYFELKDKIDGIIKPKPQVKQPVAQVKPAPQVVKPVSTPDPKPASVISSSQVNSKTESVKGSQKEPVKKTILEEISELKWPAVIKKKRRPRKIKENPNQMNFLDLMK